MKIIFAGTPANAASTLQALLQSESHQVVAVLTRPDAPIGRKRVLTPSAVAQVAEAAGIPTIKAKRVDAAVIEHLSIFGADLGIIVAYGALLGAAALKVPTKGWVNIHYSLLPLWRGAAPVQNALLHGDTTTGVTIFQLDEGMDTGAVWLEVPTEIQPDENSGELLTRLTSLGISAMFQVLPEIASGITSPRPQIIGVEPLAAKPTRELAKLDFTQTAIELERKVRAFNPEPMAHAMLTLGASGSEPFRVLEARALGATDWASLGDGLEHLPGLVSTSKNRVLVHCGKGTLLELKSVQPAGKKPMAAADWARGIQTEAVLS